MGETVSVKVARLEKKLEAYHKDITRLLNDEIKPLKMTVEQQGRQITVWKGALTVLGIIWTAVLTYIGVHKH